MVGNNPQPGEVWEFDGMVTVLVLRPHDEYRRQFNDGRYNRYFYVLYLRDESAPEVGGLIDWVNFGEHADGWEKLG